MAWRQKVENQISNNENHVWVLAEGNYDFYAFFFHALQIHPKKFTETKYRDFAHKDYCDSSAS